MHVQNFMLSIIIIEIDFFYLEMYYKLYLWISIFVIVSFHFRKLKLKMPPGYNEYLPIKSIKLSLKLFHVSRQ